MSSKQVSDKEKDQDSNISTNYDDDSNSKFSKTTKVVFSGKEEEENDQKKIGKQDFSSLSYQGNSTIQQELGTKQEKITIDYMARDFASFRAALIDLIPRKLPQWEDRSEADLGIMLIELFSSVADELSYFQDRVANEAFLRTARSRASVSNHLRLIDYQIQNGLSANTFIKVQVKQNAIIPARFQISTYPERGGKKREESADIIMFETLEDQFVSVEYNEIPVKNIIINKVGKENEKDDSNKSSRSRMNPSAILQKRVGGLKKGQCLLLYEKDLQRNVVLKQAIIKLAEDSKITDDGSINTVITWEKGIEYPKVAGGRNSTRVYCCANIIKASHGRTIRSEILKQEYSEVSKFSFTLKEGPLTFISDASNFMEPRSALKVWVDGELWEEIDSLLNCGPLDQKYSISTDEGGYATILFGDNTFGLRPRKDSLIKAEYRVGYGSVGNVSGDTLTQFDLPQNPHWLVENVIESVSNPMPATGGIDIESIDDAKIAGPKSLEVLQRAVTLKDYEDLVKREFKNEIANARARFVYTGSWDTVFVSVDLIGGRKNIILGDDHDYTSSLYYRLRKYLDRVRMIGFDVQVEEAKYVPIEIGITVCLQKHLDSSAVRDRILSSLSSKDSMIDGGKGLFHPDNFTFGDPVYASKIYEILKKIPEVKYGIITTFRKRHEDETAISVKSIESTNSATRSSNVSSYSFDIGLPEKSATAHRDEATKRNLELGYISVDENEIIAIDNDPSHPENGILTINLVADNEIRNIDDGSDDDADNFYNYALYNDNFGA